MDRRTGALSALLGIALALGVSAPGAADVLRYTYRAGDQYRLVDHVRETVAINGRYSHRSEILDRIAVKVNQVAQDGLSASHSAEFQTSERAWGSSGSYSWGEDYQSEFVRDGQGHYTIDPSYWMPVVRDVPLFPERDLAPGDDWSAPGYESHDFRQSLGMPDPFRFPITVNYQWLRNEKRDGIDCAVIGISYDVFYKVTARPRTTNTYPVRVTGTSQQTLWWDLAAGRELAYEETFDFIFTLASGDEVEFAGDADGQLVEAQPLDRQGAVGKIQDALQDQGVQGATVRADPLGVTITIENVNFQPNSSELASAEQDKLRRIASILSQYPDRDILVTGHTASVSGYTPEQHQALSEQRAKAVGDFLVGTGARRADQVTIRGMGDRQPIGDNATEEGRRQNRRVEITILEN